MPLAGANLFQAILDPLLVVQGNGVIVDCNEAAVRFMGFSSTGQVIGRRLGDFSLPPQGDDPPASTTALGVLQKTLATGSVRMEWVHHRPDGCALTLDVAFSVLEGCDPPLVLVHWHDVTERKQMEDALRRSEERYRLLAENAHDVIWVMGLDGRFTYVSPSVQRLRGYTPEEVMQQPMDEALTPASLRVIQEGLEIIAKDVQAGIRIDRDLTEVEQPCKDGSTVWTEVKTNGLYDDAGRFIGLLGVTRDISERRQRDEQLRQLYTGLEQRVRERTAALEEANAQLAKASQHKDEFLATISHELRTPLTGIMGLTETLEEEVYGPLTPRQHQAVRLIWQAGEQLRTMINGILDLSRLQAHDFTLRRARVLVDGLCRLSLRVLEPPNCTTAYRVSYTIDHPDLVIEADDQRIVQMLSHLLGNAAKFTPAGGRIDLHVRSDPADHTVTLSVSDTGIGIDAGDLPRLFQPFVQLDARLARSYAGAGIGLALARAIAEMHGGSVGVESQPGVGSRFWVTLPLVAPD